METVHFPCLHCGETTSFILRQGIGSHSCRKCGGSLVAKGAFQPLPPKRRLLFGGASTVRRLHFNDRFLRQITVVLLVICGVSLIRLSWSSTARKLDASGELVVGSTKFKSDPVHLRVAMQTFAQRYLETANVETLLRMTCRRGVRDERIRECYQDSSSLPIGGRLTDEFDFVFTETGEQLGVCAYEDAAGKLHSIVVMQRPEGLEVYWPSVSGFCDMSVERFLRELPEIEVTLMVSAWESDYFNGEFFSDATHVCLRLTDVAGEFPFYGFLSKSAREDIALLAGIEKLKLGASVGTETHGFTIRARFPKGASDNQQVEITKIVCAGWLPP